MQPSFWYLVVAHPFAIACSDPARQCSSDDVLSTSARHPNFWNCDLENVVQDVYFVHLVPEYSFEDHKNRIGDALLEDEIVGEARDLGGGIIYSAMIETGSALEGIRSHPGVKPVEFDLYKYLIL